MMCVIDWEAVFTALGVVAELLVAGVIYYEWEGGKLDRFLEDVDKLAEERNCIYEHYAQSNCVGPEGAERRFRGSH
jgi:hypothetical protein